MAEPHQPPYPFQPPPPPQQHQSMAPWYGMPPHAYSTQQAPVPPPQHHSMSWTAATVPPAPPPPGEQVYSYVSQPYHAPPQGDFYRPQQVHHHYPPPPQPAQAQFTYMYGQQDQVWQQANNSWGYQQWPHPAQTASLSQEEVWAAKARAWAASKAVQDESRPGPNLHQDYAFQHQEQHPIGGQQQLLQPPGQEAANVSSCQANAINQGQIAQQRGQVEHPAQSLGYGQAMQGITSSITPESVHESFEQKVAQVGGQSIANDSQAIFSTSQVHDAAASYGLDTTITGPQGNDRLDSMPLAAAKKLPAAPVYPQQATHLLPQSQASPLISQPHLPYSDKVPSAGYEQQQQQVSSSYLHPPAALPQPPAQVPHQPQKLPLQTHYQASMPLEGVEGEFGLSPGSLQNWAPTGGPGMPFPPAMGAGNPQFDSIHTPHQLPVPWRPDGSGLQGLGFPNSAPFVVGTSPGLGPGAGPPVRPLFAPDSFIERPKKAAVPSWLREELMKKKAAGLAGNASGMISSDESSRVNGGEPVNPLGQKVGISDKLRSSSPGLSEDEEEDQEEEIEAARSAAINQEIKRLLTEVLLKVTGDLFREIAQEVLDEDDDMPQGTPSSPSPDEQSRFGRLASPSSPNIGPPSSGRVLVSSSGKNPATEDNDIEKESSDSEEAAGNVLGLGNYASDDETPGPNNHDSPTEKHELVTTISVDQIKREEDVDAHKQKTEGAPLPEPVQKMKGIKEDVEAHKRKTRGLPEPVDKMKGIKEESITADVKQETNAHQLDVQRYVTSPTGRDTDASLTHVQKSTAKEDQSRADSLTGQRQPVFEQSSSVEKSSSKGEGRNQDMTARLVPGKGAAGHTASDASFKKLDNKDITGDSASDASLKKRDNKDIGSSQQDTLVKDKKREERREDRPKDVSVKERKREEKPALESKSREERNDKSKAKSDTSTKERNTEERMKDSKEVKRGRGSGSRIRDSSRERRKEKDKVKPRERESERDRKKQEKREREGRSKRGDAVDKKARHRSRSSSSSAGREGSSSSGSDRSRGRQRTRRSSRHHTSTLSPGRSRKRRASRSRSRSRSPHVKHTHRRNVRSPSHEKSRRSRSKSPVHRRGRG